MAQKPDFKGLKMIHGADYCPEQWLDMPEVLEKDIEYMKETGVNCVSLGMFAWVTLEPQEGVYQFEWLKDIMDKLYENGIYTCLATPSAARPAWLAKKYPEVLRVSSDMTRNMMGGRHNHCYTSPVYRQKIKEISVKLSQQFGSHPGVILWHLSNEYGGDCFCPLCQEEFRKWVKNKYKTLDALNTAWWSRFWSHTITDWGLIEAPVPKGEMCIHGLNLDWRRFVTDRTLDFMRHEIASIREGGSKLPVTTNLMTFFYDLNYFKFKDDLDIASWDSYPRWHKFNVSDVETAVYNSCFHDIIRSIKQMPFLLMESTPSTTNWMSISKVKKPGMHELSSLSAVAHGSDSVQYFQWRKSRGSVEKFHGAVVSHDGRNDTRVFKDVERVGERLKHLGGLCGSMPKPQVAIIYDWENRWAVQDTKGPRNIGMGYDDTIVSHYWGFWAMGVPVDFIDMECDLSGYDLIVAPMLYMYRNGIELKLRDFVERGGTLVGSCFQGLVDETDLCYLGDTPYGMTDVYGIRYEEIDGLYDGETNAMEYGGKTYTLKNLCERIHPSTAKTLAVYQKDFYAGEPVLTENSFGKGKAYYIASQPVQEFMHDFYRELVMANGIKPALDAVLPQGVTATRRIGDIEVAIIQNYNPSPVSISLRKSAKDYETGEAYEGELRLEPYGVKFLVV